MPRIGDKAPDFTAQTTQGEITLSKWQEGKWIILFSHPADFTPVCSTELVELGRRYDEFTKRNAKLIGISVDSVHSHLAWVQNLKNILGVRLPFPLIADSDRTVSAIIYYPLNVGRNIEEISRVLDALQTAYKNTVTCPANWKPGDEVIVPPPKTEKEVDDRMALTDVERLDFYLTRKSLS